MQQLAADPRCLCVAGRVSASARQHSRLPRRLCARFKEKVVYIGSILGFNYRGWKNDGAVDGIVLMSYIRPCGDALPIEVWLDPGCRTGVPRQRLAAVVLFQ